MKIVSIIKEKFYYWLFKVSIKFMRKVAKYLKYSNINEVYDRLYIKDYIVKSLKYIKGDVLEFNGHVIYKDLFAKDCNVMLASGFGTETLFKDSDFYFDIMKEESLPDKKFDTIVITHLLPYFVDGIAFLKQIKGLLKPHGHLIITTPGPIYLDINKCPTKVFYTMDSLKELCEYVFGNTNVFDQVSYGSLEASIAYLLGVKFNKKTKIERVDDISVVLGVTCKNE